MNITPFYRRYCAVRLLIAPLRMKTDFETVKTVAIIDELINRAETVNAGAYAGGRFGGAVGHTVENLMGRAEKYAEALARGEYPLKGKFTEPGMSLIDHSFVEKDGRMHLFYNRGYIGFEWDGRFVDTIGHAVTDDLIHWDIYPPCLTADAGAPDDYQVWAPGVTERDGRYYMYYTGVNIHVAQTICLATSDDLFTWKKHPGNPVVLPGDWTEWRADRWSDCRDSMVMVDDDGTAYMNYCTSRKRPDGGFETAMGIASSTDMVSWEDRGAYHFDICDITLESPFVLKHDGRYYLFYTNCGYGTAYAMSDNPVDGWQSLGMLLEKQGDPPACPANVPSCAEVFEFKGNWYISCAQREPGCEQYLEIFALTWNSDGTVTVGDRLE
jgi:predicted GH43/DUF377 family glycosyl hydrolase